MFLSQPLLDVLAGELPVAFLAAGETFQCRASLAEDQVPTRNTYLNSRNSRMRIR